jgi:hypothetical protein
MMITYSYTVNALINAGALISLSTFHRGRLLGQGRFFTLKILKYRRLEGRLLWQGRLLGHLRHIEYI